MEKDIIPFDNSEILYRAVLPSKDFWKQDGTVSSGAFKDSNGLSTDRSLDRPPDICIKFLDMHKNKPGGIVSFPVDICPARGIILVHDPVCDNDFHTLVLGGESRKILTSGQAKHLAKHARIERFGIQLSY